MIFGKFRFNRIIMIAVPAMILSAFFCYYMASKYKQQKPFPHATITSTACHYPQDIVFRFVMEICSSILALTLFMIFRWIQFKCIQVGYHTKPPKYQFYLSQFSIFCYSVTLSTIDGKKIGKWHTPCALVFFILWVIGVINLTVFLTKLRNWDTRVISLTSIRIKQIISVYLCLLWVYFIYGLSTNSEQNEQDVYVVVAEWNSFLAYLLWLLSFIHQWKFFNLSLRKSDTVQNL